MQQPREFHQFGTNLIDIHSIQTISRLSPTSYRLSMSNGDKLEIDGEERCKKLTELASSSLGAAFNE